MGMGMGMGMGMEMVMEMVWGWDGDDGMVEMGDKTSIVCSAIYLCGMMTMKLTDQLPSSNP